MKANLIEMEGFLRGKCLPGDMLVNETNSEYLVRKFAEAEAKCAALAAENAALKEEISNITFMRDDDFFGSTQRAQEVMGRLVNVKTPATDAFRAELRAQGAEECVRQLVISDDDDFSDAPNICAMVAHQLRKGAAE